MLIEKILEGTKLTVLLSGKLNTITSPNLAGELADLTGITELVFDLAQLEQISSAGLRVLLDLQCTMDEQGKMKVIHVCDAVYEVFNLTGFTRFLTIE